MQPDIVTRALPKAVVVDGVANEIANLLERRLKKFSSDHSTRSLNINPFMLAALEEFHGFHSLSDMATFVFTYHAAAGHSTAFGKVFDEKILPSVFGTRKLNAAYRVEGEYSAAAYNEIDQVVGGEAGFYMLSLKAGPWTIQDTMAHTMYKAFKEITEHKRAGKGIVVGVIYGTKEALTNKYDILRGINPRQQKQFVVLDDVHVLAGREFWAWLNGGEQETQEWVLEGITKASREVFSKTNVRVGQAAVEQMAEEMSQKLGIPIDTKPIDWLRVLRGVNG
jgi:hypothetical protein